MVSYRELEVYVTAHKNAVATHQFSLRLPQFELHETGSQIRRSSKSISANIVEGFGRRDYKAEFLKHLVYAQASCDETIEWFEYIKDCHTGLAAEASAFVQEYSVLGKRLNRFRDAVDRGHLTESGIQYQESCIQALGSSIQDPASSIDGSQREVL